MSAAQWNETLMDNPPLSNDDDNQLPKWSGWRTPLRLVATGVLGGIVAWVVGAYSPRQVLHTAPEEPERVVHVEFQIEGDLRSGNVWYWPMNKRSIPAITSTDEWHWTTAVDVTGISQSVGLVVESGDAGGHVACRIVVGGKVLAEQYASGTPSIASCTAIP